MLIISLREFPQALATTAEFWMSLKSRGVPMMIPVSPSGIFCANGWEYYVSPLFKHLGIYTSDVVCYAYRGLSEKAKRIEIHAQGPSILPKKEPIQIIPLSENGFPHDTTHKRTTRGGKRMLLQVLPYLVERGLINDVQKARGLDKIDISTSGLTRYGRVRIGNFSYLSLVAYLNYLDRCGIRDIEKIRFEITGKKLWISVLTKKEDGALAEPHLTRDRSYKRSQPLNIGKLGRTNCLLWRYWNAPAFHYNYISTKTRGAVSLYLKSGLPYCVIARRLCLDSDDIIVVFTMEIRIAARGSNTQKGRADGFIPRVDHDRPR